MLFAEKKLKNFPKFIIFFLLSLSSFALHASDNSEQNAPQLLSSRWKSYIIPGAKCGYGGDYRIFVRHKNPNKLALMMRPGGACWSYSTCFGIIPLATLKSDTTPPQSQGVYSEHPNENALHDYTQVVLPYCTGDFFVGRHKAWYSNGRTKRALYHYGKTNIEESMKYIFEKQLIQFEEIEDIALVGHSAGAIGSLFHISTFIPYFIFSKPGKRTLISDSPGLHFGSEVWQKFPPAFMKDVHQSFTKLGFHLDDQNGNMVPYIKEFCSALHDWNVGIIQSSRDFVMSRIFGDVSPFRHRRMVLGPLGLSQELKDPRDNCSAFIPYTFRHVFLEKSKYADGEVQGKTALEFVNDLVEGRGGASFVGDYDH